MTVVNIIVLVLVALIGAGGTIFAASLRAKVSEIHVLVNSNLTAVTDALARKVTEVNTLESENATLRGEPASTAEVSTPPTEA